MQPRWLTTDDWAEAADRLRRGYVGALPTETVYGLAADALNTTAVARIFELKGRPAFNPLIVHVPNRECAMALWASPPEVFRLLMDAFWPGPLTLVAPKSERIPDLVTGGLSHVAVRIPTHDSFLRILERLDRPIAAPSANRSTRLSPTTAEAVAESLPNVDFILDGGPSLHGIESTILGCFEGELVLLRKGAISVEAIETIVGPLKAPHFAAPQAPGQLAKHYAPATRLILAAPTLRPDPQACLVSLSQDPAGKGFGRHVILSESGNLTEAASRLYETLRQLDKENFSFIAVRPFPKEGLGAALNDRIQRAAASE